MKEPTPRAARCSVSDALLGQDSRKSSRAAMGGTRDRGTMVAGQTAGQQWQQVGMITWDRGGQAGARSKGQRQGLKARAAL